MSFSSGNRDDVLKKAARRLGRRPSAEELAAARNEGPWDPSLRLWDEQDVTALVSYLRAHAPRIETGEAPDDWGEHSASVMENFKEEQTEALAVFDLKAPLQLAQIAPFLIKRAENEPAVGDLLSMMLPSEKGWAESVIQYFRGYFQDEWLREVRECRQAKTNTDYRDRMRAATEWARTRANPLYHFSLIVDRLEETTRIGEMEAIAFLLADAKVLLPRLTYQPSLRCGGKNPAVSITVGVYDLSVEPDEVARLYRRIRSELLQDEVAFPFPDRGPRQRVPSMDRRTREMLSFCRGRKSQKFPVILKEWNAAHPDWTYSSSKSLYNAYKTAEARWGIPKKKRDE